VVWGVEVAAVHRFVAKKKKKKISVSFQKKTIEREKKEGKMPPQVARFTRGKKVGKRNLTGNSARF